MNLSINNKLLISELEKRYNLVLKVTKGAEIKKALKLYFKERILNYLATGQEVYVKENFKFKAIDTLDLEPTRVSEEEMELVRESIFTLLNQDKYKADSSFYERNKEAIIKEFLIQSLTKIKISDIDCHKDIFKKIFMVYLEKEFFEESKISKFSSYYYQIKEEDIIDSHLEDIKNQMFKEIDKLNILYERYKENIDILYSLVKDNYDFNLYEKEGRWFLFVRKIKIFMFGTSCTYRDVLSPESSFVEDYINETRIIDPASSFLRKT